MARTKTALTLVATKRGPQKRVRRERDWTAAMEQTFADVLADTCNVTLAGKAIKRSSGAVYAHRARSAAFRALWEAALATGYSRLDSPVGESGEAYRVRLDGSGSPIEFETSVPEAHVSAEDAASLGGGAIAVSVVQVGDRAVSRAATTSI